MRRAILANILRKLADAIENSNVDEQEDFDIEVKPTRMRTKPTRGHGSRSNRKTDVSPEETEDLLGQLDKVTTREAAFEVLERLELTRKELEALARPRSVHFTKDDNVQRIKEKLVEAIVGSRLNSLAIRGK
jgi:hypothetical protein